MQTAASPRRSRRVALVIALAAVPLLGGGIALVASRGHGEPRTSQAARSRTEPTAAARAASALEVPSRRRADEIVAKPGSPLELYLQQSRYPPASRPLSFEDTPDLIDWNARDDESRRAASDPEVELHFTGDAIRVVGDRAVTTTLRVRRGVHPVAVKIASATVTAEAPLGAPLPAEAARPIALEYRSVGGAYTATFRPAQLEGIRRAVDLVFRVEVDLGGGQLERVALAVGYTPEGASPARFTGAYRDVIENGSLVIYAGIEVVQPGWYNIDANLWGTSDQPVAWTRFKGELSKGQTEVRLMFFGKVLVDSGVVAPWKLGQLRGFRFDTELAPAEQWIDPPARGFTTRGYALSELSPAEWESPERDRMVQMLLADEAAGQAPPIPAESFGHDMQK